MRIIDRYILKSTLSTFLGCTAIFQFLYVIIDIFSHLDELLKQKIGLPILTEYYFSYLPIIFVQITPIACLLATIYTLGNLNRHNEIIAMRSAGLSIWRISRSIIIFGFIISVLVLTINEKVVPRSEGNVERIKGQIENRSERKREETVIKNLTIYGLENRLFFINQFSMTENTIEGIVILEQDKQQNLTRKIVASSGKWQDGIWKFYESITYDFDPEGQVKNEPTYYKEELMDIPETPEDFIKQRRQPEFMDISQLKNYINILSKSGAKTITRSFKVDLYQRIAFPFTNLIIMILGIPFALQIKKRASALSSVGISILLGFLYYVACAFSLAFGKAGFLPPILAASLGHIIFLSFGLYKIRTTP